MKLFQTGGMSLCLFLILLYPSCGQSDFNNREDGIVKSHDENSIIGRWKIISSKVNEKESPAKYNERIWEIHENGTFETQYSVADKNQWYNGGKYFLPDDQTIVTVHANRQGKLSQSANYYQFQIKNDTLYLKGNFYRMADGAHVLIGTSIEEVLIRVD